MTTIFTQIPAPKTPSISSKTNRQKSLRRAVKSPAFYRACLHILRDGKKSPFLPFSQPAKIGDSGSLKFAHRPLPVPSYSTSRFSTSKWRKKGEYNNLQEKSCQISLAIPVDYM
jgi:hypothetical protein